MPNLTINKRLNLVLEVERADKSVVRVHSVPISKEIYEANYTFVQKVMSSLYADDFAPATCSRIAYLRMRELATEDPKRYGDACQSLLAEIWRLTNVLVPTERGYEQMPFYDAMKDGSKVLDPDDIAEVQNYICFFTAASWSHSTGEREGLYQLLNRFGALTTSSAFTEYQLSLQTSKQEENTGEKVTLSSIPV